MNKYYAHNRIFLAVSSLVLMPGVAAADMRALPTDDFQGMWRVVFIALVVIILNLIAAWYRLRRITESDHKQTDDAGASDEKRDA